MSFSKIYLGDSFKLLEHFKENNLKVNAIITDPPYNISKKNNLSTMKNKNGGLAHRKGIDFGEWDKDFDLFTWMDDAVQILDKNGSMFVFNAWKNLGDISRYAEQLGMETKDLFRWEKTNPMPRNRDRRYIVDYELGLWMVKRGAKWTFNRLDEKYERPKFVSPSVGGKEKTNHPTQKPISLMEFLIKIHTNENDIVLDPFMGSGSTGVACAKLNRNFIGIDNVEEFFDITKERILKINSEITIEEYKEEL